MAPGQQIDDAMILRQRLAETEAALVREQERTSEKFRELLDGAPVMVWTSGTDALCTFFNRAWAEFRGRRPSDDLGNAWTEGIHPDDRDLALETYLKAFTARQPFRVQYRLRRGNGEFGWVEVTGIPQFSDGEFTGSWGLRSTFPNVVAARSRPTNRLSAWSLPSRSANAKSWSSSPTAVRRRKPPLPSESVTRPPIRIAAASWKSSAFMRPRAWCATPSAQA